MGVTIEIYRSRIGSHQNFIEGHKSNFQGPFWNEMLLKFYISLLLPPNIKFMFNMIHKGNEQYHALALLIRAVRFQKCHLGSGFGPLVVKKPRFGSGFGYF